VVNASDHSPQMGDKTDAEMVAVPIIRHCPASLHGLGIMRRIYSTRITWSTKVELVYLLIGLK